MREVGTSGVRKKDGAAHSIFCQRTDIGEGERGNWKNGEVVEEKEGFPETFFPPG